MFDRCSRCQAGRRYCGQLCASAARQESLRRARAKYQDRGSKEGREAHRLEERERRKRRAADRVGDQRGPEASGAVCVGELAVPAAITEARREQPDPRTSTTVAGPPRSAPQQVSSVPVVWPAAGKLAAPAAITKARREQPEPRASTSAAGRPRSEPPPVSFVLVVVQLELQASLDRVGTQARCRFCQRQGRIERVVSAAQWRQMAGRGVAWRGG